MSSAKHTVAQLRQPAARNHNTIPPVAFAKMCAAAAHICHLCGTGAHACSALTWCTSAAVNRSSYSEDQQLPRTSDEPALLSCSTAGGTSPEQRRYIKTCSRAQLLHHPHASADCTDYTYVVRACRQQTVNTCGRHTHLTHKHCYITTQLQQSYNCLRHSMHSAQVLHQE